MSADMWHLAASGLRTRRLRSALAALGVSLGIAAMVGVVGLSRASQSELLAQLDQLGTNLLTVQPGVTLAGSQSRLPGSAPSMVARVRGLQSATAVGVVSATVRRNELVSREVTSGVVVFATAPSLLSTIGGTAIQGRFLDSASAGLPTVVLGSRAAANLGIDRLSPGLQVVVGQHRLTVIGVLGPFTLAPELDRGAFVGDSVASRLFGFDNVPSAVYVRGDPDNLDEIRSVLARTANPAHPEEVRVTRPSDALAARAAARSTLTSLFLGLGAVALIVGGVGIANVMVIAVLERRGEIGLRRALGANRRDIRRQFLGEAVLLSLVGGLAGAFGGAMLTIGYEWLKGWPTTIPALGIFMGTAAAVSVGAIAGLLPAHRASSLSPTEALRVG